MNRQQYIEETTRMCRDEWFRMPHHDRHVVRVLSWNDMNPLVPTAIEFGRPDGSSTHKVTLLLHGGALIVTGDIGDAIYRFSRDVTPEFLRTVETTYLMGKCCASEVGNDYTDFDPRVAVSDLKAWIDERHSNGNIDDDDISELIAWANGRPADFPDQSDWRASVRGFFDFGHISIDDASSLHDFGCVPSARLVGHAVALGIVFRDLRSIHNPSEIKYRAVVEIAGAEPQYRYGANFRTVLRAAASLMTQHEDGWAGTHPRCIVMQRDLQMAIGKPIWKTIKTFDYQLILQICNTI